MTDDTPCHPSCFADLKIVFPLGPDGLRHTPRSCMICVYKTECLRSAMARPQGLEVREEALERAYRAGAIGFLDRWSRKKALHRRRQTEFDDPRRDKKGTC